MAKKPPVVDESAIQDFSGRYRGAQQIETRAGGWFEFAKVGDELVGEYRGMEPFRNGVKGKIKKPDGEIVAFSCATLLQDLLQELQVGDRVAIVLCGFQGKPKPGMSPMKVYQVFKV